MARRKNKIKLSDHYLKIIGVVLLIAIVSLFKGDYSLMKYFNLKQSIETTQNESQELKRKEAILEAEADRLETDLDYIEKIAREKYRMTKKGEKLIRVIDKQEKDKTK